MRGEGIGRRSLKGSDDRVRGRGLENIRKGNRRNGRGSRVRGER